MKIKRSEYWISVSVFLFMLLLMLLLLMVDFASAEEIPTTTHFVVVPSHLIPIPTQELVYEPPDVTEPVVNTITVRVTAYAPFDNKRGICADINPAVTSRGHRPSRYYAAVDPSRIAYGTRLSVPGYDEVIAGDTGGALRSYEGYAIDVYFDTYDEAMAWGVQFLEVEVLE